jgi:ferric-dicitrate binding protein FerR (iron transport regulator)
MAEGASVSPDGPTGPEENDPIERALEEGLARSPLTDDTYTRMHAAVAAEWRTAVESSSRRPRQRWLAMAAALVAATVVGALLLQMFVQTPTLGIVARVDEGALVSQHRILPDQRLEAHAVLRVGNVLVTSDPVLVELQRGGTLRIAAGSRLEVTAGDEVSLDRGEVYLDFPPDLHRGSAFVVRTPLALVEHLGTQFDVAVANELRIRVREGSVLLRRGSQTETAAAGTELVVPRIGQTRQRTIATHGAEWSWVEALEPDFPIEDRKLSDFLQWAARESGRQVSFQDEHAREVAERTRLHGSIHGLSVTQALETIFATTSLRYNFEQGRIEVSSGS